MKYYNTIIKGFHMSGVKIDDGAIIGIRTIVTKDIPYYTIIGGIPAKVIRKRFGDNIILKLLKIKRWDWPVEKSKQI